MKYFYDLSSLDEVKTAYKKYVRQLHPDIAGEAFTEQFQEMQAEKEFAEWRLNTGYSSTGSYTSSPESKSGNAQARREEARQRSESAKRARRSEAARKAAETRRRNKAAEAYRRAQEEAIRREHEEYLRRREQERAQREREQAELMARQQRENEARLRAEKARQAEELRKAQEAEEFRKRAEAEALRQREAMKANANLNANTNKNKNNSSSNNSKNMKQTSFFSNVTNIADLTAQFQTLALQFITEPEKLNAIRLEYLKIKEQLNAHGNDNLNGNDNANHNGNAQKAVEPWLQIIDYSDKSFVVTGFGEPEDMDKGHQYKYIERYFLARFEKVAGKRCSVNVNLRDGIRGIVISKKVQADVEKLVAKLNKKERPQYDPEYKSEKKSA